MGYTSTIRSFQRLFRRSLFGAQNSRKSLSKPDLRFFQFSKKYDSRPRLGVVSEDGTSFIELSGGSCVSNSMLSFLKQDYSMSEVKDKIGCMLVQEVTDRLTLLPPILCPGKIICLGLNYYDHCEEQDVPPPKEPVFFSKYNTAIIGPKDFIIANKAARRLDYETELAVIIGKVGRNVPLHKAMDIVFGYSVGQDITARDWQKTNRNGGQWLIGKSMDSFFPFGPTIVHKSVIPDIYDLKMITCVNGEERQHGNTGDMIFQIDEVICRLTRIMTLCPGDVILTGTPAGVGAFRKPPIFLKPGDRLESHIHSIGTLRNHIIAPDDKK